MRRSRCCVFPADEEVAQHPVHPVINLNLLVRIQNRVEFRQGLGVDGLHLGVQLCLLLGHLVNLLQRVALYGSRHGSGVGTAEPTWVLDNGQKL